MIWERDPLFAKAKLFLERAFSEEADGPLFGLWCSLALELLARAALASISPTLLASPENDHKNLLHALGHGNEKSTPKSIDLHLVLNLCTTLFEEFTEEDKTACLALANQRNAEFHSALAAFEEYPSKIWLPGFYHACESLAKILGESLESLLGAEAAATARDILVTTKKEVIGRVQSAIAAYKKVFESKPVEEQEQLKESTKKETDKLVYKHHHRVKCPACGADATLQGDVFGPQKVEMDDDEAVVVRQSVSPKQFSCSSCGLKLQGYAEIDAANLGGTYTRRTIYSPAEYYGLVDPENDDMTPYIQDYLSGLHEYDNE